MSFINTYLIDFFLQNTLLDIFIITKERWPTVVLMVQNVFLHLCAVQLACGTAFHQVWM